MEEVNNIYRYMHRTGVLWMSEEVDLGYKKVHQTAVRRNKQNIVMVCLRFCLFTNTFIGFNVECEVDGIVSNLHNSYRNAASLLDSFQITGSVYHQVPTVNRFSLSHMHTQI